MRHQCRGVISPPRRMWRRCKHANSKMARKCRHFLGGDKDVAIWWTQSPMRGHGWRSRRSRHGGALLRGPLVVGGPHRRQRISHAWRPMLPWIPDCPGRRLRCAKTPRPPPRTRTHTEEGERSDEGLAAGRSSRGRPPRHELVANVGEPLVVFEELRENVRKVERRGDVEGGEGLLVASSWTEPLWLS